MQMGVYSLVNMLDHFLIGRGSPSIWNWLSILFLPSLPFLITVLYTKWRARVLVHKKVMGSRMPPTLPYYMPYIGHVVQFMVDGGNLLTAGAKYFGTGIPFKIVLGPTSLYILSGADMVSALFKQSRDVTGTADTIIAMEHAFGTPRKSVEFYEADNSGLFLNPLPHSTTKPEDRIFYIIHKLVNAYLSGPSLNGIIARFQANLALQVSDTAIIGDDWVELDSLYGFLQEQILDAAVRSMFGDYILTLNPSFIRDFWAYDRVMRKLFMRTPKWMDPGIYRARDKMVENIRRWHRYANEHFDVWDPANEDVEWEPYFGAKFSRERQKTFLKMKALDETARAAEDLGLLWAANANAIPAAAWVLLETLRSSALQSRVLALLAPCLNTLPPTAPSTQVPTFDIPALTSIPLLQSIYAETLRLRIGTMATRVVTAPSLRVKDWLFQKGDILSFASSLEGMNENVWNLGREDDKKDYHPIHEFWAERFLVSPNDTAAHRKAKSKTTNPATNSLIAVNSTSTTLQSATDKDDKKGNDQRAEKQFSLEGLTASWIPYGGGQRLCPGRHFAKQEMLSAACMWLVAYEMELLVPQDWRGECDKSYYGFGTMPPKGKIPARIRRRRGEALS